MWPPCPRWFSVCIPHSRGRRYCSEQCRLAARNASCDRARRKYVTSVQNDPILLAADRKKRVDRAKARRDQLKRARTARRDSDASVPEHTGNPTDFSHKIEIESVGALSAPSIPEPGPSLRGEPAGRVTEPDPSGTCGGFYETPRFDSAVGRCSICGRKGRIRWRVPRHAGTRSGDRQRVAIEGEDDP